jgi:transcriptional regulator with XRE-family HTH domain
MSDNGITDEQLAAKIGVSRVQVLRLRKGENKPSPQTAEKLEIATGIPAGEFIFGERAA